MNNALRMNDHLYLLGLQIKQPSGFNHFKSFIHQCGRINSDFSSHIPVRMLQGMFPFYIDQIIGLSSKKRTTGSRKNYFFNFVSCFTHKALKYGRMF